MKRLFFLVAIVATFTSSVFAQETKSSLGNILAPYLDIKNALINGDSQSANAKSADLLKALNAVDMKSMTSADMNAFMPLQEKLAFDARHISESKDIAHQREHFASLSQNFYKLAKAVKLTEQPLYYAYCPMKKSYWLSAEQAIKNPYFGNQMLTCGKVTETLGK